MTPSKKPSFVMAMALIAAFAVSPALANDEDGMPEVQQQGNVSFVSGGIGQEESDALQAMQHNFNLRIMSTDKTGHFMSETRVVVSDANHQTLIDITGGPLFYVKLPAGRYTIDATSNRLRKSQTVTVASGKPSRIHFTW